MARWKEWGRAAVLAAKIAVVPVLFFGTTQVRYEMERARNIASPSSSRAAFEQQYGFPLQGFESTIENFDTAKLSAAVYREQIEEGEKLPLRSVSIKSSDFLKQSLDEQISSISNSNNAGYGIFGYVMLNDGAEMNDAQHEIKHARFYKFLKGHPDFLRAWEKYTTSETGDGLYLTLPEIPGAYIERLRFLVPEKKLDDARNERLGFISTYARTNLLEDVAELGERAENIRFDENNPFTQQFIKLLYTEHNERVIGKVNLLENYEGEHIIPAEFSQVVLLQKHYIEKDPRFMKESAAFLRKHPQSVYTIDVRRARARCFYASANPAAPWPQLEKAVEELKKGLQSEYKDIDTYRAMLQMLEKTYARAKNEPMRKLYHGAILEHRLRQTQQDVSLAQHGVNDYLIAHGEKF